MEINDVCTVALFALFLGTLVGRLTARGDQRIAYERGRLDGINLMWPFVVGNLFGSHRPKPPVVTRVDKTSGGGGSDRQPAEQ